MNRSTSPAKKRRDHHQVTMLPVNLSQMQIKKLSEKYLFNEKEILMIKSRFEKFADKGILKKKQFKDSLGIMGLEPFLSDRIFSLIDEDKDDAISFEDFVRYISILLNGSGVEKALWSFKLLSNNKNTLEIEDFENMIFEMCYLWNSMTGSKSIPQKEFVANIFALFDNDNDGLVSFEEFNQVYSEGIELIGWFEFLNNEDINLKKVKEEWDTSIRKKTAKKRATIMQKGGLALGAAFQASKQNQLEETQQKLKSRLKVISGELQSCLEMIRTEREYQQVNAMTSKNILSFYQSEPPKIRRSRGPVFHQNQAPSMWGDDDPEGPNQPNSPSHLDSSTKEEQFQLNMMQKLRHIITLSEEIKSINSQLTQVVTPLPSPKRHTRNNSHAQQQEFRRSKSRKQSVKASDEQGMDISLSPMKSFGVIQQDDVRKNLSIYFGHENWNLVLNMMIGIRKAIKNLHPLNDDIKIDENHYNMKYQFEIVTKRTSEFDYTKSSIFYEYAPMIFERIRKIYGVTNDDYLRSVGPEQLLGDLLFGNLSSLTEKVSSGKSGSFFYYSFDDKYMLKTISRDEFLFFKRIIKRYYEHLAMNYHTLIIKMFGLYKMKMMRSKKKSEKIYFVVMVNIFCTEFQIRERYDLKGSLYGRTSRSKKNPNPDISVPLKDLDWIDDKRQILYPQGVGQMCRVQIEKDLQFFEANKIIDYSFLIGYVPINQQLLQQLEPVQDQNKKRFYEKDHGGVISSDKQFIYLFGIIDIFTEYNTKKQMEHNVKSTFVSKDISCIPPPQYADRFKKFMFQYIN